MKHLVIGYHGTSADAARSILDDGFRTPHAEPKAWLGKGTYFWEADEEKAWRWARRRTKRQLCATIRAQLDLTEGCLDLTTLKGRREFREFIYELLKDPDFRDEHEHVCGAGTGHGDTFFIDYMAVLPGIKLRSVRAVVMEGDRAYGKVAPTMASDTELKKSRIVNKISVVAVARDARVVIDVEQCGGRDE